MQITCPQCHHVHEVNIGSLLGSVTSRRKSAAVRANGKLGGRPKGSKNKKKPKQDANQIAHSVVARAADRAG